MPARRRRGIQGTETPRMKDGPTEASAGPKRPVRADRRARLATFRALDAFLKLHGADAFQHRRWMALCRAITRGLPSRSASVCDLVAQRIQNAYLAEKYTAQAKEAGEHTSAGAKLVAAAHGCTMHVQRLALHARDLALRESGLPVVDPATQAKLAAAATPQEARRIMAELFGGNVSVSLDDIDEAMAAAEANVDESAPVAVAWQPPPPVASPPSAEPEPAPLPEPALEPHPVAIEQPAPPQLPPEPRMRVASVIDDDAARAEILADNLHAARAATTNDAGWQQRAADEWTEALKHSGSYRSRHNRR